MGGDDTGPHPARGGPAPSLSPGWGGEQAEEELRGCETADGWMERSTCRATPGPKPAGRGQWRSRKGSGGGRGSGAGGALGNAVCHDPTCPAKPHSPFSSSQEHFPTSEHPEHLQPLLLPSSERQTGWSGADAERCHSGQTWAPSPTMPAALAKLFICSEPQFLHL